MTAEGFKYQLSTKLGDSMLNVRADSAEEFRSDIDALFGEGASTLALAPFLAAATFQQQVSAAPSVAPSTVVQAPVASGDAPTEKQIAFARQLGIDPTGMTKKALSTAIDAKVGK